jgi:hypothetical protein
LDVYQFHWYGSGTLPEGADRKPVQAAVRIQNRQGPAIGDTPIGGLAILWMCRKVNTNKMKAVVGFEELVVPYMLSFYSAGFSFFSELNRPPFIIQTGHEANCRSIHPLDRMTSACFR